MLFVKNEKGIKLLILLRCLINKNIIQMKKHDSYQFSEVLIIRINEFDKKMLKRDAFKSGKKLSQYVRDILLK